MPYISTRKIRFLTVSSTSRVALYQEPTPWNSIGDVGNQETLGKEMKCIP